jgi:hypothetical protein
MLRPKQAEGNMWVRTFRHAGGSLAPRVAFS